MAGAKGRILMQMSADTRRLRSDLTRVRTQLTGLQKFTRGISSSFIAMFGGFAVIQGFRNTLNSLKGLEFQMSKVAAISGATSQEMEKLRTNAIAVGGASKFTAQEVGKLQEELARLGKTTPEITAMTDSIAALTIVADTELGETAQSVAKTINAFQLTAKDTTEVTNIMAESFSKSALNLEKFQVSMANVGAIANVVGFSLAETTALLGVLVDNGIEASKAGTDLRKIFSEINQRGLTLNEALNKIKGSTNKASTAFDLFGQRAFGSGVILANNTGKIEDLTSAFSDANKEIDRMRKLMEDNLQTDLEKAASAFDALIQEGSNLLPVFRKNIQAITEFVQALAGSPASVEARLIKAKDRLKELNEEQRTFKREWSTSINLITGAPRELTGRAFESLGFQVKFAKEKVEELQQQLDKLKKEEILKGGMSGLFPVTIKPKAKPDAPLVNELKEGTEELKKRTKAMFESGFAIQNIGVSTETMLQGVDMTVTKVSELDTSVGGLVDTLTEGQIAMQKFGEDTVNAMEEAGIATLNLAISGETSMKKLGLAFLGAARQRIALAMAEAIGSSAKLGIFGIPLAIAAVAAFTALFDSAVRGFAEGGRNISAGLAVVGERGPELLQVPGGSNIIPNNKIGGIGGSITINFNGLVTDEHAVGQEITNILNKYKQNFG